MRLMQTLNLIAHAALFVFVECLQWKWIKLNQIEIVPVEAMTKLKSKTELLTIIRE